ncbi:hypothetical protein C8Q70DRAFT_1059246 [Cubamyces menziesii]|nr:hypothetical protein C8Q70DRAFT_1059246 [Cubamyces menziesii]
MSGKAIIVEYDEFMEWFVSAPPREVVPTDLIKTLNLQGIAMTPESRMFTQLVDALNQDWLLPNDRAISNANLSNLDLNTDDKINAGLYRRSDVPMIRMKTRWVYMELSLEFKTEGVRYDPFDESRPSGNASAMRQGILRQIMCYSCYIFDNQRRTHHFMLIIFGKMVRIMRWDRSGVVATKPFDYVAHPELLLRFIWRFGRMSPAQRGHDPTATRVAHDSALGKLMLERAKPPSKSQDIRTQTSADGADQTHEQKCSQPMPPDTEPTIPGDYPRALVDDAKGYRYFLVGKTHFRASGLSGRGTQTFVAIDEADPYGPFVYLKDAWRAIDTDIKQEGKILERLNSNDDGGPVPFVPTVRCHGDVKDQTTQSQEILRKNKGESEVEGPLKTLRHYRLVVNEVGKPLTCFHNMKQVVGLITLAIRAHGEAYRRKGLIHGDISPGNVLIYPDLVFNGEGVLEEAPKPLLVDWESAKCANSAARQPNRTRGTWQFMSASVLGEPSRRIAVQDDLESFFHLLLHCAIRFCRHNWSDVDVFMDAYFDGYIEHEGVIYGGKEKLSTMRQGKLMTPLGDLPLCFYMPEKAAGSSSLIPSSDAVTNISSSTAARMTGSPPQSSASSASSTQPLKTGLTKKAPPVTHPINKSPADVKAPTAVTRMDAFMLAIAPSAPKAKVPAKPNPTIELTPAGRAELEPFAAELANHQAMFDLLRVHYWGTWPDNDRCLDQLPSDYKPNNKQRVSTGI